MARPAARAAPTLESVAARAGVSRATAGRVLAGSTTVRAQARDAVLAAGGRPFTPVGGLACVDVDNVGGARAAVALLAERGRRQIATITGPVDLTATIDRSAGVEAELAARGLPGHGAVSGDFTFVGGRQAM